MPSLQSPNICPMLGSDSTIEFVSIPPVILWEPLLFSPIQVACACLLLTLAAHELLASCARLIPMPSNHIDPDTLRAALIGYQVQRKSSEGKIAEIRKQLGQQAS